MKRRIDPYPPLAESISDALKAASVAHEAVRHAQKQAIASYDGALRQGEKRLAALLLPITERLQAARHVTTVARIRLRALLNRLNARGTRRKQRASP